VQAPVVGFIASREGSEIVDAADRRIGCAGLRLLCAVDQPTHSALRESRVERDRGAPFAVGHHHVIRLPDIIGTATEQATFRSARPTNAVLSSWHSVARAVPPRKIHGE